MRILAVPLILIASLAAAAIPAGTKVQVRLLRKVCSNHGEAGQAVEAIVISPVRGAGGEILLPIRTRVHGRVNKFQASASAEERAWLEMDFYELRDRAGKCASLASRVVSVDNARESVDDAGRIVGILGSESFTARIDQGIDKLASRYPQLADLLAGAKGAFFQEVDTDVDLPPGVDFTLELTKPLNWKSGAAEPALEPVKDLDALAKLVNSQPFRTQAENPPKPSDMTNLMFIGTAQEVQAAFLAAGWSSADALDRRSAIETLRAVIENRGYKEAPMSVLLLDGQKAEMDFQKQYNTFAKRHHLRIWRRPDTFQGRPVWVSAATHDIAIEFSPENRTFIHKIDSRIDLERTKVVDDLVFAGHVQSLALVERPEVPKRSENATGDALETDGRMAVAVLKQF